MVHNSLDRTQQPSHAEVSTQQDVKCWLPYVAMTGILCNTCPVVWPSSSLPFSFLAYSSKPYTYVCLFPLVTHFHTHVPINLHFNINNVTELWKLIFGCTQGVKEMVNECQLIMLGRPGL